jgi:hypothetical protein
MIDWTDEEKRVTDVYARVSAEVNRWLIWLSENNTLENGQHYARKSPDEWQRNLRFDYELDGPRYINSALTTKDFILLKDSIAMDLTDLIINGDTTWPEGSDSIDPFMMTVDGEKKRGKRLKDLIIASAVVYYEYKYNKDSTELVIFMQPHFFWE